MDEGTAPRWHFESSSATSGLTWTQTARSVVHTKERAFSTRPYYSFPRAMETDACEPTAGDSSAQVEVSVKRDTRGTEYNQFLVRAIEDAGFCMRSSAQHMDGVAAAYEHEASGLRDSPARPWCMTRTMRRTGVRVPVRVPSQVSAHQAHRERSVWSSVVSVQAGNGVCTST